MKRKISHKGTNSAGLYLHEILRVVKTIQTKGGMLIAGAGRPGARGWVQSIICAQFWFGKTKTWMLDGGDGVEHTRDVT